MENTQRAISWILRNSASINLSIEKLGWIGSILPGWTDIRCSIHFENVCLNGWGSHENEDIALIKAFCEVVERLAFHHQGLSDTSNGFAAHLDRESSISSSIDELIERDLFLAHFLTKTPFADLNVSSSQIHLGKKNLEKFGLCVRFGKLGSRGSVCIIDGKGAERPFGFITGAAYKHDIIASECSSFVESARTAYWWLRRSEASDSLSICQFDSIDLPSFRDHGRLGLNLEYRAQVESIFLDDGKDSREVDRRLIFAEDVSLPTIFKDCPIFVTRAWSPSVQNLILGRADSRNTNLARLREFLGQDFKETDINDLPHPLD